MSRQDILPRGRRRVLRALAGALLATAMLPVAQLARAAETLRAAFAAQRIGDALKAYGAPAATPSPLVTISADELAERGDNVRFVVTSSAPGSDSIALFAERNPQPLAAVFHFGPDALPFVSTQLKLAETTSVRAVVRTRDGQHLEASRKVTVTISGCS